MTDRYAVFGNPIAHSKSPFIHAWFARQTEQDIRYTAEFAPVDGFADAAANFFDNGGRGCNVTAPFKLDAAELADTLSDAAVRAGAVNTLMMAEGRLIGDTTDGVGLVRDLTVHCGIDLSHKRVLVIGAGGAVRGVLQPILRANPGVVQIANRSPEKATQLASAFADVGNTDASSLEALSGARFDVVINGTSSGLSAEVPAIPAGSVEGAACYDMGYAGADTAFMRWCTGAGAAQVFDGLGMLVEQAAESFTIWRGVRPDTSAVRAAIREPS